MQFSFLRQEYPEFVSEPVTVVARELGNNIQKSQLLKTSKAPTTSKRRSKGSAENSATPLEAAADANTTATVSTSTADAAVTTTVSSLHGSASVVSMDTVNVDGAMELVEGTTDGSSSASEAVANVSVTMDISEDPVTLESDSDFASPEKSQAGLALTPTNELHVDTESAISAAISSVNAVTPDSSTVASTTDHGLEGSVTTSSGKKSASHAALDPYLKPNDPVFTGTMKYPNKFVFWQVRNLFFVVPEKLDVFTLAYWMVQCWNR